MPPLIASDTALHAILSAQQRPFTLYLDCEFVRERTFWPQLALVQVNLGGEVHLIDPLTLSRTGALPALVSAAEVTVMHSPSEDLECLLHAFGCTPPRLFDTQLAAAFCELGPGLSYRALVEQFCGVTIDKSETRSDWLARPLSEAQLRYAAEDVIHLPAIHLALQESLRANQRGHWFEADCAAQIEKARRAFEAPAQISLEARQTQRLTPSATARLQCILSWREQEARRADRPRAWILDNETAYRLASVTADDEGAHRRVFESSRRHARKAPEALWKALQECPQHPPARGPMLEESTRRRVSSALQDEVARCAETLGLPASLLFPRRMIDSLVDEATWPAVATGWREEILKERLTGRMQALIAS